MDKFNLSIDEFGKILQKKNNVYNKKIHDFINKLLPKHSVYSNGPKTVTTNMGSFHYYQIIIDHDVIDEELINTILKVYKSYIEYDTIKDNTSTKLKEEYSDINMNILKTQTDMMNEKDRIIKLTDEIHKQNENIKRQINDETKIMESSLEDDKLKTSQYKLSDNKSKEEEIKKLSAEETKLNSDIKNSSRINNELSEVKCDNSLIKQINERETELKILHMEKQQLAKDLHMKNKHYEDRKSRLKIQKETLNNKKLMIESVMKKINDYVRKIQNTDIDNL